MDLDLLKWAANQGGAWLALIVILVLYRKDHMHKQTTLREAHDRRDKREDRLLEIIERHATAAEGLVNVITKLDSTLAEHHRFAVAQTEKLTEHIMALPGKVSHDVAGFVERTRWRQQHHQEEP